ncbi:MAG: invasin domain 3-containing protein, partial [Rhodothermales bacterium]
DNNDGTYTATLTAGVVAGTATITGTINGAAITDDADVTLNVGAAGSSVSLVQTSTTPDGDSVYTITIAVTDSDGNNVGTGGDDVSIASTVGVVSEVIDNQDGTYTATLTTSPQEGMAVITITVNGADNSTSTEVTLGPGDANAGRTTISANPLSIVADGQSTSTITIQAKDADGHNLADGGDAVVLATTLGSLGSVVDNLDGTYTATLTAGLQAGTAQIVGFINSDLISSTAQISFTEPNSAPVAVIEASVTSGRAPLEVILDGHSSSDANGDLLTYEWDLGDGTSSQEILITHIFEEGIFDVLLVVSDGNLTDSASVIIEVDMANIAPEAVITASSYVGQAPFLVDFSASASSDANGDSLGFSWDMGDGATRIGESVSHTYGAPGLFTVVLTVTDGSLSDNAEAEISVASGVSVEDSKLPAEVVLKAIYPNPFNLTTMVTYGLPSASKVRITATDLLGRQVATLVAGDMKAAGYHTVQLNADGLASGTYLILIEAGDFVASQQVVLLK